MDRNVNDERESLIDYLLHSHTPPTGHQARNPGMCRLGINRNFLVHRLTATLARHETIRFNDAMGSASQLTSEDTVTSSTSSLLVARGRCPSEPDRVLSGCEEGTGTGNEKKAVTALSLGITFARKFILTEKSSLPTQLPPTMTS